MNLDEPGVLTLRQDYVEGKSVIYVLKTPPRFILMEQAMLKQEQVTIDKLGQITITVANSRMIYKLAAKQLHDTALTLERVSFTYKEAPAAPVA